MFGRNSEEGAYYAVEIVVDSNTKVYKRIARGYVAASRNELLNARELTVWFSGGSEVEGHRYRGTAETIVID